MAASGTTLPSGSSRTRDSSFSSLPICRVFWSRYNCFLGGLTIIRRLGDSFSEVVTPLRVYYMYIYINFRSTLIYDLISEVKDLLFVTHHDEGELFVEGQPGELVLPLGHHSLDADRLVFVHV